jgi:hypothetical protein
VKATRVTSAPTAPRLRSRSTKGGSGAGGVENEVGAFGCGEFGDGGAEVLGDAVVSAIEGQALDVSEAEFVGENELVGDRVAITGVDGEEFEDGDGGVGVALAEVEADEEAGVVGAVEFVGVGLLAAVEAGEVEEVLGG